MELRQRGATTLRIQDTVGISLKLVERCCRFADKKRHTSVGCGSGFVGATNGLAYKPTQLASIKRVHELKVQECAAPRR